MDLEQKLRNLHQFGMHMGLERIHTILDAIGNPHLTFPVVHVTGTNGKGSVCAYLSSVLTAAGYRVGRYTSPHLIDWNERICLNEQPISTKELEFLLTHVDAASQLAGLTPTQFESLTAAAFLYFARQAIDIGIIEVGLGGRLDATNVFPTPLVSVITSIGFDHCQQLGSTLTSIATEKAGILKAGCPAVIGELSAEASYAIAERLQRSGCSAVWAKPVVDLGDGWVADQKHKYWVPLRGKAQLMNVGIAIATLRQLQAQGWSISDTSIAQGIANTRWAGRLQWVDWQGYRVLLDGAHNVEAATVLRQFVDEQIASELSKTGMVHWVVGMFADKDQAGILHTILRPRDAVYTVPILTESWAGRRAADPAELATLASTLCPTLTHSQPYADLSTGLQVAAQNAIATENPLTPQWVVVCGSLYLVGEILQQIKTSSDATRSGSVI